MTENISYYHLKQSMVAMKKSNDLKFDSMLKMIEKLNKKYTSYEKIVMKTEKEMFFSTLEEVINYFKEHPNQSFSLKQVFLELSKVSPKIEVDVAEKFSNYCFNENITQVEFGIKRIDDVYVYKRGE